MMPRWSTGSQSGAEPGNPAQLGFMLLQHKASLEKGRSCELPSLVQSG